MILNRSSNLRTIRHFATACLVVGATLLSGCANMYVDTATKEVPVAELKKIVQPKPVQLVFEFQNQGAPNATATNFLKDAVFEQVKNSGLFALVETAPSTGVPMLNVTLNNVPITKDAASQGFVTGLTFGLAGSAVTDGYICTVSYLPAGQIQPIVKTAKHAIHTTIGNATPPANAQKAPSADVAVKQMTREVLSNALKDLSFDESFN